MGISEDLKRAVEVMTSVLDDYTVSIEDRLIDQWLIKITKFSYFYVSSTVKSFVSKERSVLTTTTVVTIKLDFRLSRGYDQ